VTHLLAAPNVQHYASATGSFTLLWLLLLLPLRSVATPALSPESLLTQRGQRIDPRRSAGGDVHGDQRHPAEQGDGAAQKNLGALYANGQGIAQSFLLAHMWSNLAEAKLAGDEAQQATKDRENIAKLLTPAQIDQAQEMAMQCEAKKFQNCE